MATWHIRRTLMPLCLAAQHTVNNYWQQYSDNQNIFFSQSFSAPPCDPHARRIFCLFFFYRPTGTVQMLIWCGINDTVNIIAFTTLVIPDIIAISEISTSTIGGSKKCKNVHKKILKNTKNRRKMHTKKSSLLNTLKMHKNAPKKYKKCKQKLQKSNKNAKNYLSGITDILPGLLFIGYPQ